jgi:dephospho-CoA kinase
VVDAAQEAGYTVVVMGNVIREETLKRGLELNPANMGTVMLDLRKTNGDRIVAERCIPKIENADSHKVAIDGLRSLHEAEAFRKHFPKFTLVAVHASPETRFRRLLLRGRKDDPNRWEVFLDRDLRELSVGLGNAIAMSQYLVINEGSLKQASMKVRTMLRRVDEKWMT